MTERPILFSAPMILALLGNRKTQTRRIVKPQPVCSTHEFWQKHPDFVPSFNEEDWSLYCGVCGGGQRLTRTNVTGIRNPYGVNGDRLWVKETFAPWRNTSIEYPLEWESLVTSDDRGGLTLKQWVEEYGHQNVNVAYRADGENEEGWMSPLFMPRWASRLTLEITEVRVQRLQDISDDDCVAEGMRIHENPSCEVGVGRFMYTAFPGEHSLWDLNAKTAYRNLWESINGKDSWDANPWLWCISFRKVEANG